MVNGIANVSGVSCHLTSALQIIFHTLPEIATCLIQLSDCSPSSKQEEFLVELGRLFRELSRRQDESSSPVDPTRFYHVLSSFTSIDVYELGDAVSGVRILLEAIQKCLQALAHPSESSSVCCWHQLDLLLKTSVFSGSLQQDLVGYCRLQAEECVLVRRKTKSRSMACPFALDKPCQSLQEALCYATVKPQPIIGYDWDNTQNYTEDTKWLSELPLDESELLSKEWTTQKMSRLASLPQHLMLHLQQRFSYKNGRVEVMATEMDIPSILDMTECCNKSCIGRQPCCQTYKLVGAILHMTDNDSRRDFDGQGGHYVALVRTKSQGEIDAENDSTSWILLDDKDVRTIPGHDRTNDAEILNLLSCRQSSVEEFAKGEVVATLLVYSRTCQCAALEDLLSGFKQSVTLPAVNKSELPPQPPSSSTTTTSQTLPNSKWQNPNALVGQRLRVRWAKGNFYPGIVASYNETSGKHCVRYDDGDVREYKLHKKEIEWED